jgi:hypothetical protein
MHVTQVSQIRTTLWCQQIQYVPNGLADSIMFGVVASAERHIGRRKST